VFRLSTQRWLEVLSGGIIAIYGAHLVIFFSHSGPQDGDQFLVFHS
jgi:surface polysaccharide O-acyltransferase-like enzyme